MLQLLDICHGLQFLHSHDVIHGDLKGVCVFAFFPVNTAGSRHHVLYFWQDNILVNAAGMACLGDFGLSSIASFSCTETSASGPHGTVRWMAPELIRSYVALDGESPRFSTRESDVYAFAMVAIEVPDTSRGLVQMLTHQFARRCSQASSRSNHTGATPRSSMVL
jgi:serine/threonine protein kinase